MVGADVLVRQRERLDATGPLGDGPDTEWIPSLDGGQHGERPLRFKLCALCRPSRIGPIVGVRRRDRVTVHTPRCRWARGRPHTRLRWRKVEHTLQVRLRLRALGRTRLLAYVLERAYEVNAGVVEVRAEATDRRHAVIDIVVFLRSVVRLAQLVELLGQVRSVVSVAVEESPLPPWLVERIQGGPWDDRLQRELEAAGHGERSRDHVLVPPRFVERRGAIRLPYSAGKPTHSPRSFVGRQADVRWLLQ